MNVHVAKCILSFGEGGGRNSGYAYSRINRRRRGYLKLDKDNYFHHLIPQVEVEVEKWVFLVENGRKLASSVRYC